MRMCGRCGFCFLVFDFWFWLWLHLRVAQDLYVYGGKTHPHIMTPYTLAYKTNYNLFIFFFSFFCCGVWQQHNKHIKHAENYGGKNKKNIETDTHNIIINNSKWKPVHRLWKELLKYETLYGDGTMVGIIINLVGGPRQGVRWSVSNKFQIYVHLFGQSQSTKENARYIQK